MAGSPEQWFKNLTPIAKTWLSIAVITTVGAQFGFVNLAYLYFDVQLIYRKFQVSSNPNPYPYPIKSNPIQSSLHIHIRHHNDTIHT